MRYTRREKTNYISGLELDKDWINNTLLVPRSLDRGDLKISDTTFRWMYYTAADAKFTNTSLGGNFSINNPPQFTTYCDPPTGALNNLNTSMSRREAMHNGMGQYYSEAIDDNAHNVTLRFGVPEYKGLFTFFSGFYNVRASTLANQGRGGLNIFYAIGKLVGMVVALPFTVAMMLNQAARYFFSTPSTKYYWMKPAMPLYWKRINYISNKIAATMGIIPKGDIVVDGEKPMVEKGMTPDDIISEAYKSYSFDAVREQMPHLFNKTGGIDIYRVAFKANRMAIRGREELQEAGLTAKSPEQFMGQVQEHIENLDRLRVHGDGMPLDDYLTLYHKSILGAVTMEIDGEQVDVVRRDAISDRVDSISSAAVERRANGRFANQSSDSEVGIAGTGEGEGGVEYEDGTGVIEGAEANALLKDYAKQDSYILPVLTTDDNGELKRVSGGYDEGEDNGGLTDYVVDAWNQGAEFISFKVDHVDTVSESWSNQVGEAAITSTINGISNTVRSSKFNFSNFNTGFSIIDAPLKMLTDTVAGVMDGFQISGLAALAGTGMVDIPKRYQDSSVSLPTANYSMELRTAYGDPLSIYMHLYLPLMCLMAGALPISHGNQAYGSPLLCQLFDRGRNNIKLGMIDSLSVTRGVGDVGWSPDGLPLGLDVSFSVVDMSDIMHMPIDTALAQLIPWNGLFGDDTAFGDYIATLSNLDIYDQINPARKLAIRWANNKINRDQFFNKARIGNAILSGNIGRFLTTNFGDPPIQATR